MKYKVNHTTHRDGSRSFVLIPSKRKIRPGNLHLLSISSKAPEEELKALWGEYPSEPKAREACQTFLD